MLLVIKNFGLIQSTPRLSRPTTFSVKHDDHLWDVRLEPRHQDAEGSVERVPKKFETIVNSLSKMIDRAEEVLIALDDRDAIQ